ncbi:hypothetical protein [Rhodococcus sp. NPDC058521]|uniref:hypothetical protein n=1 Tax=Rhodococcus sp. NPDC058521 TaxID=3346536 RepID=UPI00364E08D8
MTATTGTQHTQPTTLDRVVLGVLVFDGFLCAVLSVLFLPLYIGGTALPVTILIAAVGNLVLARTARSVTGRTGTGMLPLAAWLFGFLVCMFGGPGGDVLLMQSPWTLLLLIGALVPSAVFLWKVTVANAFAPSAADSSAARQ